MHKTLQKLGNNKSAVSGSKTLHHVPTRAAGVSAQPSALLADAQPCARRNSAFRGLNKRVIDRVRSSRSMALPAVQSPTAASALAHAPGMKVVEVDLGDRSYPIYIGAGLLNQGELLRRHIAGKRALIVTNETIAPLYLEK